MKLDRSSLWILAGSSLFVGVIIISVGIGAILPAMHRLSAPLICRGQFEIVTTRYNVVPGETVWQHNIYCTDQNGQREITFLSIAATGLLASVPVYVALVIWLGNPKTGGKTITSALAGKPKKDASALNRLSELKKMRDADLITEAEYQSKKKQIMDEM